MLSNVLRKSSPWIFSRLASLLCLLAASLGAAQLKPQPAWSSFVETNFPFFSSVLDARSLGAGWPTNNLTPRGLILSLGNEAWACFDVDLLRVSAIWTGGPVTPVSMSQISYHSPGEKVKEGQTRLPQLVGIPWIVNGVHPGWQAGDAIKLEDPRDPGQDAREVGRGAISPALGKFQAVQLLRDGVSLEYEVAGIAIRERIDSAPDAQGVSIRRSFRIEHVVQPLWLVLGTRTESGPASVQIALDSLKSASKSNVELIKSNGVEVVRFGPSRWPLELDVTFSLGAAPRKLKKLNGWKSKPARRWKEEVSTIGKSARERDAYVLDSIPLPFDNPWRRNVRIADLAFFPSGKAAAVTFDGDVWMISGLRGNLERVTWRRFASGLHEPLSMVVRNEELFVFDRNGIWRLRDTDGNGEADRHELFSNGFAQTAETREFATGMRVAPDGSFIISKGGQQFATLGLHNGSVLRVSADGRSVEVLGWGLRMPFIGVHPRTGLVTASDQQGYYIPATPLHIIRDRQYYGFLPSFLPKDSHPAPIAEPLTWIPHPVNASGASQVWLDGAKMGPLNGGLIHIGYYRPELLLVLTNARSSTFQAAVVSLARAFDFAPLNGVVNPVDGQLYVTGFQTWGTEAAEVSGLARLRYTGQPSTLPREIAPMKEGVLLRFDVALDPVEATRLENFSAERWNYRRTASYGSPHYKFDGSKGQETVTPSSAYLSRDGKSVFLGLPDMKPVMQMRLGWSLSSENGMKLEQNAYFTVREMTHFNPSAEGFDALTVDLSPRAPTTGPVIPASAGEGQRLAGLMGCSACHSTDGTTLGKAGPSWKGLFGNRRQFADGTDTMANDDYLRESIREPAARIVKGFETSDVGMPGYEGILTDTQIESLVLFLKAIP